MPRSTITSTAATTEFSQALVDRSYRRITNYAKNPTECGMTAEASIICARPAPGEPNATCNGDSGGPNLALANGQWQLVGVTTRGVGCSANSPG
ncbi:MAG: trypsin-like serine protease [Bifidobacteriaceae bacterium]|nr:trypsin-like serine protease [Bifidobacteriaceae bacterium]